MTDPNLSRSESDVTVKDEAMAVVQGWLVKAYPRAWQRDYVARNIVKDLSDRLLLAHDSDSE